MSYTQVLLLHLNALMLVIILRLTFIVVVFNIVKVPSEALRKKVNDMRAPWHSRAC